MTSKKVVVLFAMLAFFSYSTALIAGKDNGCKAQSECEDFGLNSKAKCECWSDSSVDYDCEANVQGPFLGEWFLWAFCEANGYMCDAGDEDCDVE
ncbi:hypothetical protein AMJ80_02645 [bacterium SM23_31]|nr:MAG: hypothetical protein AMJ80_02645 [bacterium SM23_31]